MAKKIDLSTVPNQTGSSYPAPFDVPCKGQSIQRLARHAGLTLFGVNLTVIEPGAWSSQRHWHSHEDEFVWVVEGELTLVTDAGEEVLRPAIALPSAAAIPTAIISSTNRAGRPRCSRSAIRTRRTAASIRTSTWSLSRAWRITATATERPIPPPIERNLIRHPAKAGIQGRVAKSRTCGPGFRLSPE